MEGDSKSGQANRAVCAPLGLHLSGAPDLAAPLQIHVLWRNLRGLCWRKKDVSCWVNSYNFALLDSRSQLVDTNPSVVLDLVPITQ